MTENIIEGILKTNDAANEAYRAAYEQGFRYGCKMTLVRCQEILLQMMLDADKEHADG